MNDDRDPLDASLQRLFAPPDFGGLQAKIDAAAARLPRTAPAPAPAPAPGRRSLWVGAVAAAVAAAAVIALSAGGDRTAAAPDGALEATAELAARRHAGAWLARLHAQGPSLPRGDDGSCLGPPPGPGACAGEAPEPSLQGDDRIEVVGECGARSGPVCDGADIPAARLVHLRLRDDGIDILVWIEPRDRDPRPLLPADAGLNVFRSELGAFVLYEVTPLSTPRALDRFRL